MRKRLARSTAPITWTLILAFSVTLSASCTTEPMMKEAAMACCTAMGHECATSGDEHDCCSRATSQAGQLLSTGKLRVDLAAPALELITAVILPTATLLDRQFAHVHAVFTHAAPTRVPKYLLASSLLI